jgi:hypothetical protein
MSQPDNLACQPHNLHKIKEFSVFQQFQPPNPVFSGMGGVFPGGWSAGEINNNKQTQKDTKTMANQPYYPKREGDQSLWFTNIQSKIGNYYAALEISPARQAKLTLVLQWLIWTWHMYLPARRADAPAATMWRQQLATGTSDASTVTDPPAPAVLTPPAGPAFFGMLTWLFAEIARWKKAEGYTDTIGADLGIVGAAAVAHTDPPILTQGDVAQNSVELLFNLYEHDGIWIESQRQGEAAFSFLATDTGSPYVDNRPVKTAGQAEWRDYHACWWDADEATLAFGPVLRVLVTG